MSRPDAPKAKSWLQLPASASVQNAKAKKGRRNAALLQLLATFEDCVAIGPAGIEDFIC